MTRHRHGYRPVTIHHPLVLYSSLGFGMVLLTCRGTREHTRTPYRLCGAGTRECGGTTHIGRSAGARDGGGARGTGAYHRAQPCGSSCHAGRRGGVRVVGWPWTASAHERG
eukprot:3051015-Prymnesium_polylepis.1